VNLADYPEVMSVDQVAEYLSIGRNQAYAAVARGEIPSVRVGRRLLVARRALEQMLGLGRAPEPAR
jgi:excisionase family DNA binding protein